jgi:hypothetical protein
MPPISMRWQEVIGALKISRIGCWTLISGKIVAGQDKKRVCTPKPFCPQENGFVNCFKSKR